MFDEINIVSKTQMIVIEPNTKSVRVIDAGPQGPIDPTKTGVPGLNAKSDYELAKDHGFVGTVTQWLTSLQPSQAVQAPTIVGGVHVTDLGVSADTFGGIHVTDL